MTSTNPPEYSLEEIILKETLVSKFTSITLRSYFPDKIETLIEKMFNDAIQEAEKIGLRGISNLGDEKIKNKEFLDKRIKAGLTKEDILWWWNRPYVWLLVEEKMNQWLRQDDIERGVSE
jgi:hypothetical protein